MPLRQGSLAPAIDAYLRKKGSPLAGLGNQFVQYGQQYGIDPRLIVAISGAETSFGGYGPSQKIHNPFGMGPGIQYPNYGSAIGAVAQNLAKNYFKQGLDTIPEIQKKWAPSGATNDPTGLNNNWVKNVSQFYSELGGDPGTAADTQKYIQTAAALESQYANVDQAPALDASQTPQQTVPGLDFISPRQLSEPSPVTPFGELTQRVADQPTHHTRTDIGSNAIANAAIQETLKQTVGEAAAQHGVKVEWDDGTVVNKSTPAYIASAADYMKQHPQAAGAVAQSKNFLGLPYVWGGTSPTKGFDCSGYVQWLYAQQGVKIGRTTYDQIKNGTAVGIKQLEPGDIVFFGTKKNPHHEGLYIGNGQFIHSPHTGDSIKISSLSDEYYRRNFVTGRRVVG